MLSNNFPPQCTLFWNQIDNFIHFVFPSDNMVSEWDMGSILGLFQPWLVDWIHESLFMYFVIF